MGDKTQGNLILSRQPILATDHYFIQEMNDDPNPHFDSEGRVVTQIEIEGAPTIMTTHMSYTHRFEGGKKREQENQKLLHYLESQEKPFVIVGDFNAVPDSPFIQHLMEKYFFLGPDVTQPTWTTKPFDYMGFNVNSLEYRLDYGFSSHKLSLQSARIIDTNYSDHLPIVFEI